MQCMGGAATWVSMDSLPRPRCRGDSAPAIALPAPLIAFPAPLNALPAALATPLPHRGDATPPPAPGGV